MHDESEVLVQAGHLAAQDLELTIQKLDAARQLSERRDSSRRDGHVAPRDVEGCRFRQYSLRGRPIRVFRKPVEQRFESVPRRCFRIAAGIRHPVGQPIGKP